jgi:predicted transcriptional regulator
MKYRKKSALPGFPLKAKFLAKNDIDEYFSNPEGIQCLLCGRIYKSLNGHLRIVHDISHEEYRRRYGLPWRRGLVSTEVSNRLSDLLTKRSLSN